MLAYRLLLHLYPSSFRAEYGDDMRAIFATRWQEDRARSRGWRCSPPPRLTCSGTR
jgi:hypothetical protein